MDVRLIKKRIMVEPLVESMTPGGILLTDQGKAMHGMRGTILAAAEDCDDELQPGVEVLHNMFAGIEFRIRVGDAAQNVLFLKEEDVYALVNS